MDQEGDLQYRRMWQVLQWPHHCPVRPRDLGHGTHTGEAPSTRRQALSCPRTCQDLGFPLHRSRMEPIEMWQHGGTEHRASPLRLLAGGFKETNSSDTESAVTFSQWAWIITIICLFWSKTNKPSSKHCIPFWSVQNKTLEFQFSFGCFFVLFFLFPATVFHQYVAGKQQSKFIPKSRFERSKYFNKISLTGQTGEKFEPISSSCSVKTDTIPTVPFQNTWLIHCNVFLAFF